MYKDIESEMIRQGHEVTIILDVKLSIDPYLVSYSFLIPIKKIIWNILSKRYWDKIIAHDKRLKQRYDCVFIISGVSVNKYILDYLKTSNPGIKSVFYTWDACNYYRFDRFLSLVDKCFTFDLEDSKNDKRWYFLPIYCIEPPQLVMSEYRYDIFSIGTNHDGRYSFLKRILPQLKNNNVNYYIKLVAQPITLSLRTMIRLLFLNNKKRTLLLEEIKFSYGLENKEILSEKNIPITVYQQICDCSLCVLDDQRDGQSGLTARFMWALASRKKIITSNKWAYQYPFVKKEQVKIIDKKNPIIPTNFLRDTIYEKSDVKEFYINNWISTILNF